MTRISGLWLMIAVALIATLFWESAFLLPVKLLVVLVHEIWHAAVAMSAGAHIEGIVLSTTEAGETMIRNLDGPIAFTATASAGYIGSTLTGGLLLNRGLRERWSRVTLLFFAIILIYMSLLFAVPGTIATTTGMGWGILFLLTALLSPGGSRLMLITLGTLFIWYCFYDMFDFIDQDIRQNDAGVLAWYFESRSNGFDPQRANRNAYNIAIAWSGIMAAITWYSIKPAIFSKTEAIPQYNEADIIAEPPPSEVSSQSTPAIEPVYEYEAILAELEANEQQNGRR